ncbi:MAG: hypothetical protein Roseis2KO_52370 [Roseivirga sp.]
MKVCLYIFLLLLITGNSISAQESIQFENKTDYLSELLTHTSPNEGADLHFIGWLLNSSTLTFDKRHSFHLGLMLTHGGEPSVNIIGDLQTFSNLEAGFLYGFNEVFYQYEHNDFWLKIGQQDINSDFAFTTNGLFYTHSSFGIDPLSTINMPAPTYPVTAFSVTSRFKLTPDIALQLGIFDGQFALPENNFLTIDWTMNKDEGLIYIIEPELSLLQGKWIQKVGFYYHSGLFTQKSDASITRGLSTFYLIGDIRLRAWENRSLDLFYQFSTSSSAVSDLDHYYGLGLKMTNPFNNGSGDELGIALGHASINTQFQSVRDAYDMSGETVVELTYKRRINPWLELQPYFQYIGFHNQQSSMSNPMVFALRGLFAF